MLEQLLIFTRGGLILWTYRELSNALKGSPIDALIQSCLLEERSGLASYNYDASGAAYTLKWAFHNDLSLVFVAVFRRVRQLLYVDDLLAAVKRDFAGIYDPKKVVYGDFDDTFRQLQEEAEAMAADMKRMKNPQLVKNPIQRKSNLRNGSGENKEGISGKGGEDGDSGKENRVCKNGDGRNSVVVDRSLGTQENVNGNDGGHDSGAFDVNKLQKLRLKTSSKKADLAVNKKEVKGKESTKPVKKKRVWDDSPKESKLDFTDPVDGRGEEQVVEVVTNGGKSLMDRNDDVSSESEEEFEEGEEGKKNTKAGGESKKGWFSTMFQSIAGKAVLERSDLEPALKALEDRLMSKNVAEDIAKKLCESVAASLEGKKLGSFTRVSTTVKAAMEEAILRILTPRKSIDIMRDVHASKEQGKPYVIVFVGVNGVGKSTNLAKVAYWLQQHNINVMMAACDTFRSGAVEQLRTHARRLQIPIFEKGYEKDPAVVAKEAIQEAYKNHSDVVLVDTAGRMQDNEPLMRALSKLINLNLPDLVLFVGEALVGNDGVDQLTKFNQKLADLSGSANARLIDGILLTKFDTIDDKVGAALSMVYVSGSPVVFVGCGQSYTDLKKLNVKSIVKTLLK